MKHNERDISKTNHLSDFDLAVTFSEDFDVDNNFGKVISNNAFEQWILSLGIPYMVRSTNTNANRQSWNNYRSTIRQYIKKGVLTEEYKEGNYSHPFCLDIHRHGQNLIIAKLEDSVINACNDLTRKRKHNIRHQNRIFKKDFDGIINLFSLDRVEAIMQQNLLEAHNKVRAAMEQSFGDIMHTTVNDTLKAIADSQEQVKKLTACIPDEEEESNNKIA